MQYKIKSNGLNIIVSDGNFRDRMFDELTKTAPYKVETPKFFNDYIIKIHELISVVNEIVSFPAYVICYQSYASTYYFSNRFGFFVYFTDEYDAMTFKLTFY